MIKQALLLFLIGSAFISCSKTEIDETIPRCVNDLITEFKNSLPCNDSKVDEYLFQNSTVFVFKPGSCGADMQSPVIDQNCNTLGSLGGIAGIVKINGENFANAVFVKTVWEK